MGQAGGGVGERRAERVSVKQVVTLISTWARYRQKVADEDELSRDQKYDSTSQQFLRKLGQIWRNVGEKKKD